MLASHGRPKSNHRNAVALHSYRPLTRVAKAAIQKDSSKEAVFNNAGTDVRRAE